MTVRDICTNNISVKTKVIITLTEDFSYEYITDLYDQIQCMKIRNSSNKNYLTSLSCQNCRLEKNILVTGGSNVVAFRQKIITTSYSRE